MDEGGCPSSTQCSSAASASNVFGPTPPSEKAIAVGGFAQWLFVAWAAWIDRHRRAAAPALLLQG